MHYLDLSTWNRREHFEFFLQFEEPFFGVCVELDCTWAYERAREIHTSFFLYYLHASLDALQAVENLRYRVDAAGRVEVHELVHASCTVGRPDGTFGFSFIPYDADYRAFEQGARAELERVRNTPGLCLPERRADVIHYTSLPWLAFTSMSHARRFSSGDTVPKIAFGKMQEQGGRLMMPVSVHAHHALADALHVSQFIELFQENLNT